MEIPLPWERLLWSSRPVFAFLTPEQYFLTDFRLVRQHGDTIEELLLPDIAEVGRIESRFESLAGASTLVVRPRDGREPLVLRRIRRGQQVAGLIELLAGDPSAVLDAAAVKAAIEWDPQRRVRTGFGEAITAVGTVLLAVFAIVAGLHGTPAPHASYTADDPIYPDGHKRDRADIAQFMEEEILPWARDALGPLKGGADRITCETCHGRNAKDRDWHMPAVAALPQPNLRDRGWEQFGGPMDAQMRNAIYGYLAESGKQEKAAYMREVVLPGMARLLHRPAYDFTQPYGYNRARLAFGCYHCHLVH